MSKEADPAKAAKSLHDAKAAIAALPPEQDVPLKSDPLSIREELQMSVSKRIILRHNQVVELLTAELTSQKSEVARLRPIELEHARLKQTRRLHRFVLSITGIALVVGGGLVSTFQLHAEPVYFSIGWSLIVIGAIIQLPLNLLD